LYANVRRQPLATVGLFVGPKKSDPVIPMKNQQFLGVIGARKGIAL
jgi:hypothetical protein